MGSVWSVTFRSVMRGVSIVISVCFRSSRSVSFIRSRVVFVVVRKPLTIPVSFKSSVLGPVSILSSTVVPGCFMRSVIITVGAIYTRISLVMS